MHWHFVPSTQVMLKFANYTPKTRRQAYPLLSQGYLIFFAKVTAKINCCDCKWVTCAKSHACNVLGSSILSRQYKVVIFDWADPRIIWNPIQPTCRRFVHTRKFVDFVEYRVFHD